MRFLCCRGKKSTLRSLLLSCLVVAMLLPSVASAALFSDIYLFGDSLSDSGNISLATFGLIPGPPYYDGRFSNGPNYADILALNLGLNLDPSLDGGRNYAFGGARTGSQPGGLGSDLLSQIGRFSASVSTADAEAIYVVFAGANNIQDAAAQPDNADQIISDAVQDLSAAVDRLKAQGAKHILVPNLPDLGRTPRITEQELLFPGLSDLASGLTMDFNTALDAMLDNVSGVHLLRFDTFTALQNVIADPQAFGFADATSRCYTGDDVNFTGGGTVCSDPDAYLFWDGLHPTTAAHSILAGQMYSMVIPEPASILLFGIGLLGLQGLRSSRRRR